MSPEAPAGRCLWKISTRSARKTQVMELIGIASAVPLIGGARCLLFSKNRDRLLEGDVAAKLRCRAGRVTLLSTKPNFISAFSPLRASARQASLASRAKAGGRYHSNLCQRIAADLIEGSPALFLDNLNNTAFKSDLLASVGAMRKEDRPPAYGRRTPRLRPRVLRFVSCLRGPVLISSTAICPRVDRTL
jgi:hypothetical protein